MNKKVLITGGSGLIGQALTHKLIQKGYQVSHLSRKQSADTKVKTYMWDPSTNFLEEGALDGVSCIIHLAGAGVFDKAWSASYKKQIIESRVASARVLFDAVKMMKTPPETFISASGVAIYGADTLDNAIDENTSPGDGFLAEVVKQWETAADQFKQLKIRTVKLRTGIVLSHKGGALVQLVGPIRYGVGAPLGTGRQFIPWIHITDLCGMYLTAIENNQVEGVYNAVSPFPVRNQEFTEVAAKILHRPLLLPHVPGFILSTYLGKERALYILGGNRILNPRMLKYGFQFQFKALHEALSNLLL